MDEFSQREQIVELINRLFVYTDNREWKKLQQEVFAPEVAFDMVSMGGTRGKKTSKQICDLWEKGFEGIDVVYHLAGNYLISLHNKEADAEVYATVTHYKANTSKGTSRQFMGNYQLQLHFGQWGWRIDGFRYMLKFATGNLELE